MRLIFILIFFSSCTAPHHLRQAERHLKKAEQLGVKINADTVYVSREIIVPEVKYDTILKQVNFTDTLTVIKDNIVTKVKVNTVTKEVYIAVKCPPDTVRINVPVTITKNIESAFPWGWIVLAGVIGLAGGLFATKGK